MASKEDLDETPIKLDVTSDALRTLPPHKDIVSEESELEKDEHEEIELRNKPRINENVAEGDAKKFAPAEIKKRLGYPTESASGDQRSEDSYLTEEDIFQMKNLTAERGTTSDAMRSVISLADTTSNFEDRVVNDDVEDSGTTDMDISVIDEREALQAGINEEISSDFEEELEQSSLSGAYLFDRHRLPNPELPSTVTKLNYPFAKKSSLYTEQQSEVMDALASATVYLIGTAHFSAESQKDVLKTIQRTQPDIVMVELCPARILILSMDEETILREATNLSFERVVNVIKESGVVQGILHVLLLSMSAHITRELGMAPGGEFRAAYDGAMKVQHCRVVLGDRPIHITLQRALSSLNIFQKIRLFYHLIISHNSSITMEEIERCKNSDMLENLLKEMAGEFPLLSKIFVEERDMCMVSTLHTILRTTAMSKLKVSKTIKAKYQPVNVVAVVGIGHVPGIVSNWEKRISMNELLTIPPPSRTSRVVKCGFRLVLAGVVLYVGYRVGTKVVNAVQSYIK